jgi:hypothetical protein
MALAHLLLCVLLAAPAAALLGVDVSEPVSRSSAACMAKSGISFGIARAWHSDLSGYDTGATTSLKSWAAASPPIAGDVYMFPCSFASASSQVAQLQANLSAAGITPGRIWLDIESNPTPKCAWRANRTENCAYMEELVAAAAAAGGLWGVYSSIHEWTSIMTPANEPTKCTAGKELPLWYPHYQSPPDPSFDDFEPFGGWKTPAFKQYDDGLTPGGLCGTSVDNNWSPKWPPA